MRVYCNIGRREMADDTPTHLSMPRAQARYSSSRAGLYRLFAQLIAQGEKPVVKNGRKTLVVTRVLDNHYASLPAAKIKAPAAPSQSSAALAGEAAR
jgi:hypothetical protein